MSSVLSGLLVHNAYGKSDVRLTKVIRKANRHEFRELFVDIQMEGDFSDAYTTGSNTSVVATDSMKNTVYALAADHPLDTIESFAKHLADHFLSKYSQITQTTVQIRESLWNRIVLNGKESPLAFTSAGEEKRTTVIVSTRDLTTVESGIEDLVVLKTGDSEFAGFVRDEFTTLPETHERIFATSTEATWVYAVSDGIDFEKNYMTARDTILEVFATHKSLAVQHTLYEMGQLILDRVPDIEEITITMPNQHRLPVNLAPFNLPNKNEIYMPTDQPYGLISGTMRRA
jgi:urate oxidase